MLPKKGIVFPNVEKLKSNLRRGYLVVFARLELCKDDFDMSPLTLATASDFNAVWWSLAGIPYAPVDGNSAGNSPNEPRTSCYHFATQLGSRRRYGATR